jgi:hypothetical protein
MPVALPVAWAAWANPCWSDHPTKNQKGPAISRRAFFVCEKENGPDLRTELAVFMGPMKTVSVPETPAKK